MIQVALAGLLDGFITFVIVVILSYIIGIAFGYGFWIAHRNINKQ
ncbi:MAG: hypothetical protein [Podoviridae sp. ctviO18]|nr:MAG: hypothetical protein [Podoviridae sp. ctviO18]